MKSLSHVQLFVTPWTVAYQVPPSVGFSREKYWSGLPFPSPGDKKMWSTGERPLVGASYKSRFLSFPGGASGKEPVY